MTSLDHVGILVPRLDEAAALLTRLGFTLTRRAEHRAASGASAGSAQCSIMLESGYVEIQEITDLARSMHILAPAARRNFGLHTLAFGVSDATAAREAVLRAGMAVGPVLEWTRQVHEDDLSAEARFAFFVAPYDAGDDAFLCWVQHLTPDALATPRLREHRNGARLLRAAVIIAGKEPGRLVARYAACDGVPDGERAVRFGGGSVEILSAADLPLELAIGPAPAPDWFAAVRIGFDDPATFEAAVRGEGFPVSRAGLDIVADLRGPLGCFVIGQAA